MELLDAAHIRGGVEGSRSERIDWVRGGGVGGGRWADCLSKFVRGAGEDSGDGERSGMGGGWRRRAGGEGGGGEAVAGWAVRAVEAPVEVAKEVATGWRGRRWRGGGGAGGGGEGGGGDGGVETGRWGRRR